MNKFLIYTSNVMPIPATFAEVINFAKQNRKYMIANVELNQHLHDVKVGDQIVTNKGNHIYVLKTISTGLDNLSHEDAEYIDTATREYNLKKVNITSVDTIINFGIWAKDVRPILTNKKKSNLSEKIKEQFMPVEAKDVRITIDGSICVKTNAGYVAINKDNALISYPEEMTLNIPIFVIPKPKEQLVVGDIISVDGSYIKITDIGKTIKGISYTGNDRTIHTIKNYLFNNTMVKVVMSLTGGINPLMLYFLSKNESNSSILPFLMMQQSQGSLNVNPMMFALMKDNNIDIKDLLLMMNNTNLFSTTPVKAPTTIVETTTEITDEVSDVITPETPVVEE